MNEHLETATAAHLTLSLRVITMQQHAINSLEAKCAAAVVAATDDESEHVRAAVASVLLDLELEGALARHAGARVALG